MALESPLVPGSGDDKGSGGAGDAAIETAEGCRTTGAIEAPTLLAFMGATPVKERLRWCPLRRGSVLATRFGALADSVPLIRERFQGLALSGILRPSSHRPWSELGRLTCIGHRVGASIMRAFAGPTWCAVVA